VYAFNNSNGCYWSAIDSNRHWQVKFNQYQFISSYFTLIRHSLKTATPSRFDRPPVKTGYPQITPILQIIFPLSLSGLEIVIARNLFKTAKKQTGAQSPAPR